MCLKLQRTPLTSDSSSDNSARALLALSVPLCRLEKVTCSRGYLDTCGVDEGLLLSPLLPLLGSLSSVQPTPPGRAALTQALGNGLESFTVKMCLPSTSF